MEPPLTPIPTRLQPLYTKLRITLAVGLALAGLALVYTFLFPTVTTGFDFRNPKSSRNQIFEPRAESGTPRTNGKLEALGRLVANTSPLGNFSHLTVSIDLEKQSETPSQIAVSIRKGYRAFLYPTGAEITDFPQSTVYRIRDTYYESRSGVLYPFVSEAAYLSRYPASHATLEADDFGCIGIANCDGRVDVSDQFIGFRVGTLLSFADGVYVVTSESEIRPIGSAEIFLALGYRFEDVLPVNEEDLGIYKRGRILLMGAPHPDGTLFVDQDTSTLFLIEGEMRHPVKPGAFHDFLLANTHPITASESCSRRSAQCTATSGLLPRALDCVTELGTLDGVIGSDYEVTLSDNDVAIDIANLTLAFETRLSSDNLTTLLAKVKQRILARFGLAIP
ncbi:MAG: hypothetical protein WBB68_01050 [Candidatus Moraniibacteriota bacterium]